MAPTQYAPALSQAGLGMPDRDYYLVDNAANQRVQAAYRVYLARLFALAGLDEAEARAARVYALEERLARGHRTREASRERSLPGLVLKRLDSPYEPGLRSGKWQKMRVNQDQTFVIGGYTLGATTFDALVVGVYDDGDQLIYVARTRSGS